MIILAERPPVFDCHILALEEAAIGQTLAKPGQKMRGVSRRPATEIPNHRHRLLLRPRRERPRSRAAEQRDEIAAPHAEHRASSPGVGHRYLPHAQPGAEGPASPWGRPELF